MQTSLCIGAGTGIGVATAKRFGRERYRVVPVTRSEADNDRLREFLKDDSLDVRFEAVKASDSTQIAALVDKYANDHLDIVHYNAAGMHYDAAGTLVMQGIEKQSPSAIATGIAFNVSSALATPATVIPVMTARQSGTILLTGDGLDVEPSADLLTLSVGKAAMRTMGQALFSPFKEQGVHIATVRVSTLVTSDPAHPAKIADEFWNLHAQERAAWTWQAIYPRAA